MSGLTTRCRPGGKPDGKMIGAPPGSCSMESDSVSDVTTKPRCSGPVAARATQGICVSMRLTPPLDPTDHPPASITSAPPNVAPTPRWRITEGTTCEPETHQG